MNKPALDEIGSLALIPGVRHEVEHTAEIEFLDEGAMIDLGDLINRCGPSIVETDYVDTLTRARQRLARVQSIEFLDIEDDYLGGYMARMVTDLGTVCLSREAEVAVNHFG